MPETRLMNWTDALRQKIHLNAFDKWMWTFFNKSTRMPQWVHFLEHSSSFRLLMDVWFREDRVRFFGREEVMEYVVCGAFGCWDWPWVYDCRRPSWQWQTHSRELISWIWALHRLFRFRNILSTYSRNLVKQMFEKVLLNMQIWVRLLNKWLVLWENVSGGVQEDLSSLNLQSSDFHLSNVLPATCVYGTWIQGTCIKVKCDVEKRADGLDMNRLNLLFHLENMGKMSYIICISHVSYSK